MIFFFFFQAEDGIRDGTVTGVQTCALPISLQILKERYEPGGDTGRITLVHDGEEGGIILSGRLEVTVDSERRILGPGDAYYFESRRPHRFRCVGAKAC